MRFFHIEFTTYPETVDVFIRDRDETGTCIMCSSIDVSRYCNQPGYMTSILDDSIITSLILLASLHHVTSLILSVVEKPFNQPATIYGQMGIIIPLVGWVQSPTVSNRQANHHRLYPHSILTSDIKVSVWSWGYPQFSSSIGIFQPINHPAIGVPPFWKTSR